MPRKDKNDSIIFKYLLSLEYENDWGYYTENKEINKVIKHMSKEGNGKPGFPDHIYVNENKKLLILIEDKPTIAEHSSNDGKSKPKKYAVDGVISYISHFIDIEDISLKDYFKNWKILGIAISGDISDEYNHRISTFAIIDNSINELKSIDTIQSELNYLSLFDTFDEEQIIKNISSTSKEINNLLRSIDSQKRPVLLSALMISLFEIKDDVNSFINEYSSNTPKEIISKLQNRVDNVLASENIPVDKRNILKSELEFIHHDQDLLNLDILKDILNELKTKVIPLFKRKTNYDIIGKFYSDFLRYAGVANVKKGIVLTPHHITTLFTELIDINVDDVIMDPCCGTGSFLISAMNKLVELRTETESGITYKLLDTLDNLEDFNIMSVITTLANFEDISDYYKKELTESIVSLKIQSKENITSKLEVVRQVQLNRALRELKSSQLIGFEKNSTMYSLAISNMLFRGDGKSQIFNNDYFDDEVMYKLSPEEESSLKDRDILKIKNKTILGKLECEGIKPTIGFINPPYGGKDNQKNPTKKEIQFLTRMLDQVSRYGIIIAPLSTFFKDDSIRNNILKKHTLKFVINMPKDLFQPNASTHTTIAVFEVNKPQNNKEVILYDLNDDGFVLSKSKGRTDIYKKWTNIKNDMLYKINNPDGNIDNITLLKTTIKDNDEWLIQAHSKTDYSNLNEHSFINSIKEQMVFDAMKEMDLLNKDIDEINLLNIVSEFYADYNIDTTESENSTELTLAED